MGFVGPDDFDDPIGRDGPEKRLPNDDSLGLRVGDGIYCRSSRGGEHCPMIVNPELLDLELGHNVTQALQRGHRQSASR